MTDQPRLADAYAATPIRPRIPTPFKPDPKMEAMIARRATDPAWFDNLGALAHISVGHYETAKAAAQHVDNQPPPAA